MNWPRLLRSELRKLTTTRLPLWFLGALVLIAVAVAAAVLIGAGTDDAEGLFDTLAAQTSLLAFGTNAMMIAGLFGAITMASEFTHGTIVPTLLLAPHRWRATSAQLAAALVGGAVLGFVGASLVLAGGAIALPLAGFDLLLPFGTSVRLVLSAALAGAMGAVFGAGIGAVVRNTGGAVTAVVVLLMLAPPIVAQLSAAAASWVPGTLVGVVSGLGDGPALPAAVAALVVWGSIPALVGIGSIGRRDAI